MLRPPDFRLYSVQAAVFTPAVQQFRKARVFARLMAGFADRYDGEIESGLPRRIEVPPQAVVAVPVRVPMCVSSDDGRWKIEVSPDRTDSFWTVQPDDEARSLADICRDCVAPLLEYPVGEGAQVGRLALVVHRFTALEDAANQLTRHFCLPAMTDENTPQAPLRHSEAFQLHNLKKYTGPGGVNVNSWVRCRSDMLHGQGGAIIEQDINTFADAAREQEFPRDFIVQFFEWAADESARILEKYFA